jgi:hypothetical protein
MKTSNLIMVKASRSLMTLAIVLIMTGSTALMSQETKTIFGTDTEIGFMWGIELKTSSIQHNLSTQYGMYAGALFNHAVMLGFVGAANVTHPTVNYGYTGLIVQYTFKPNDLVHLNGQLTIGSGSTKDYENEKSSMFDNFGNVSGERFYLTETGINGEINLGLKTRLVLGVGYRYVYGINQNSEYISRTHVSDKNLSGFNFEVGIKFGLY